MPRPLPPWEPPPDPRRPEFPYRAGRALSIWLHVPPPPFGMGYTNGSSRPKATRSAWPLATQTDWCLQFPPQEAPSRPHPVDDDASVRTLHIVDEIACGDQRGVQVVRCRLGGGEEENKNGREAAFCVAKIYDALYYPLLDDADRPLDVTYQADRDYSCEAAAYECLCRAGADGRHTPPYFGSWTFDAPVLPAPIGPQQHPTTRPVRLVLLAWIPGTSMWSYLETNRVDAVPPAQRLEVLAKALESECYLSFYGIYHNDFEARNVLVTDSTPGANLLAAAGPPPDVYIIDFNRSYVIDLPCYKMQRQEKPALPANPMYRFWGRPQQQFGRWVPEAYLKNRRAFNGWLKCRWGQAKGFREPSDWDKEHNNYEEFEFVPLG